MPDADSDEGEEVAEDFDSRLGVEEQLERAADRGKGAFLLCTFKEVFDRISPDAAGLREAYADALHFKYEQCNTPPMLFSVSWLIGEIPVQMTKEVLTLTFPHWTVSEAHIGANHSAGLWSMCVRQQGNHLGN